MKNITIALPDEIYRRARVWAAERDTSVSAVVAHLLETLPDSKRPARRFTAPHNTPAAHAREDILAAEIPKPVS